MEIKQDKNGSFSIKGKQVGFSISSNGIQVDSLIIPGPGEYEIGGMQVVGLGNNNKTNFKIKIDNIKVAIIYGEINEKQEEAFSDIDVLIPLTAQNWSQLVIKLEPKIVVAGGAEERMALLKGLGKDASITTRLVIKKESLPTELEVVWLKNI